MRRIHDGGTARSSSMDETKSLLSSLASGSRNWTTGSSRKCGRSPEIASRYGNENWEFNDDGLMAKRFASINDLPISESDRKYHWPLGRRPDDRPGLSELGF